MIVNVKTGAHSTVVQTFVEVEAFMAGLSIKHPQASQSEAHMRLRLQRG